MKAIAKITCDGSERVIEISASQKPEDTHVKINVDFNPPLKKEEEAKECESVMHFLFNCFIRGIEKEEQ